MYTSVVAFALSGLLAIPQTQTFWQHDYLKARQQGEKERKPLAVIVGSGTGGFHQLSPQGQLSEQTQKLLREQYVCVFLDTSSADSRTLVSALRITQGRGIVLSDRSGELIAFRHDGSLADGLLIDFLRRFADPNITVTHTATAVSQVSYYPSATGTAGTSAPASYRPAPTVNC